MTHAQLAARYAPADSRSLRTTLGWTTGIVAVIFVVAGIFPTAWYEETQEILQTTRIGLEGRDLEFVRAADMVTSSLTVVALVVGIITAGEFRTYLGAGVTRMSIWTNARKNAIALTIVLVIFSTASQLLGIALDSAWDDVSWSKFAIVALASAGAFLLAHEFGYFVALMHVRLTILLALAATLPIIFLSVFTLVQLSDNGWEIWTWIWLAIILTVTIGGTHKATSTLPMRRNGY